MISTSRSLLARYVREARLAKGLSQEKFGELLGVTKGNVSAWENDHHKPSLAQIRKTAEVTSVAPPRELLYSAPEPPQASDVPPAEPPPAEPAPSPLTAAQLTPDEAALLDNYRHSPPAARAALKATSAALAQRAPVKKAREMRGK